jgi:small subunit ribosomal protein S4
MARHTDPVCKLCRREGMKLFLKSTRCDTPKCAFERREYPPGMHQWKKGKPSPYGVRLREKQKLKRYYGVMERQFRRLFEIAGRMPGNTGDALLSLLERRLDNIVCRLGIGGSRAQARQLVRHGHVLVNRRRVDIPSYLVKAGDTISIKNRPRSLSMVKPRFEGTTPSVPDFLELVTTDPPEGKVVRLPGSSDVSVPIQVQLVVEMLSK